MGQMSREGVFILTMTCQVTYQDTLRADPTATGDNCGHFWSGGCLHQKCPASPAVAAGSWAFLHVAWPSLGPLVTSLPS